MRALGVWAIVGLTACGTAAVGSAPVDVVASPDVVAAADVDEVLEDVPVDAAGTDATTSDGSAPGNAQACLLHTTNEADCKDCCDCQDLACADVIACRDACPSLDFSKNDDAAKLTPTTVLGPGGNYGLCTQAATEDACKSCCECDGNFACGDKRHCRDACVTAGSTWPTLELTQLGAPVQVVDTLQFAEGPVWSAQLNALLFSDVSADTIFRLDEPAALTVFRKPSQHANGLALDPAGALLACEHSARRVTRTTADGTVTVLADKWQGKPLNSPNDLTIAADGTVYFTDPTYGLGNTPSDLGFTGLYRIAVDGTLSLEAQLDGQPNGVSVTPGGKSVLVALTTANKIVAFDVGKSGALGKEHAFFSLEAPDGFAVDQAGNVYVAGLEGGKGAVVVLNPIGKRLGSVLLAHQPTNCGFGGADGKTLYVTAREAVYRMSVPIPGL